MYFKIVVSSSLLFFVLSMFSFSGQTVAFEDGDFYKIISPENGNVLTVGSGQPTDGAEIILSPWNNQPNQKWLAVQAVVAGDNYLLMPQQQRWDWNRFLRSGVSLRETKERHDSLPDWSLVLNGDSAKGLVTVQTVKKYQQWRSEVISGSSSKRVIIKNLLDNKCLTAPSASSSSQNSQGVGESGTTPAPTTTSSPGFFRRVRNWFGSIFGGGSSSSTSTSTTTASTTSATTTSRPALGTSSTGGNGTSNKITLASCDSSNLGQQWSLELQSIR